MVRIHRSTVASLCATCALLVAPAFGQPFTTDREAMTTGRFSADREIKMGDDFLSGRGVNKDEKQAAYWYEKAAKAGNPWAQKQIGFFYEAGIGVPADPVRAVHWYQLAAAGGLVSAKTNLGVAYLWGSGVAKDASMAAHLFREAAGKGDGRAATYLGDLYGLGNGVEQDKAAAEHWYLVGAKRHDPVAEFDLGMLFSVEDHPHDFRESRAMAAEIDGGRIRSRDAFAGSAAGSPSGAGEVRSRIPEPVRAGFRLRSVEILGSALGILFSEGKLIARDPAAAYYYLELATLQGGDAAPKHELSQMLQKLSTETGSEEASKQEAAARAWYRQHPDRIELLMKDRRKDATHRTCPRCSGGGHSCRPDCQCSGILIPDFRRCWFSQKDTEQTK